MASCCLIVHSTVKSVTKGSLSLLILLCYAIRIKGLLNSNRAVRCYICVWIWKNCPQWHKNWNPIYNLTWMLHSCTIHTHQTHGYRWPDLLSQMAFCWPAKPWGCITGPEEPVNDINKYMRGAKLLPTTIPAYPVDCVCFCDLLKTQHCCLSSNGRYNPPLAAHPPPPPTSL